MGLNDACLEIRSDEKRVMHVMRILSVLWKFRGNQTIVVDGLPMEVFWDVHNWLFDASKGNIVFMFPSNPAILSCKSFIAGHALHSPALFVRYFIALLVKSLILSYPQLLSSKSKSRKISPAEANPAKASIDPMLPAMLSSRTLSSPARYCHLISSSTATRRSSLCNPKCPAESSASPQLPVAPVYLLALILKLLIPPSCKLFLAATLGVYSGKLILHRCCDLPPVLLNSHCEIVAFKAVRNCSGDNHCEIVAFKAIDPFDNSSILGNMAWSITLTV
ncbi:hypothetical protein KSP40_PGU015923 [Platanthera guangdongensis]|uniref:Uncharacterized protein n=1 Tax=Platanthera guangdongensis TaxID=2320717 RepID=A0ABR2LXM1_9ASPA